MDREQFKIFCLVLLLSFLVPLMDPSIILAQEVVERELAIFAEIPIVITASRRIQPITESPSAISVITQEDIKFSGATQLSEVFAMIPGVHIGYTTHNSGIIGGVRGFHKASTNTIQLLLDGVPWDFEVYGIPEFNPFPVGLEEIERIEVLRGPGSSLYGPDAVSGVINVITKKLEDTEGNLVSLTAGEKETYVGTLMHGGSFKDKVNYRVSSTWDQRDDWGFVANLRDPVGNYLRTNGSADVILDDNSNLNIFGSYIDVRESHIIQEGIGPTVLENAEKYATSITYTSKAPNVMVRGYWQVKDVISLLRGTGVRNIDLVFKSSGKTGIEFQHNLQPFEKCALVWGANFTQLSAKSDNFSGRRRTDLSGEFVDTTYKFTDKFSVNAGLRLDNHPNTGDTLSHRLSFLHSPWEDHNFRFTWATSFRNPSFIENYYTLSQASGMLLTNGVEDDMQPEKAETLELGYRGKLTEKLSLETNVFYTKLIDSIAQLTVTAVPPTPTRVTYQNLEDFYQVGSEVELKYPFTDWLSGVVNYTFYDQWEEDPFMNTPFSEKTFDHMFNAQLRAQFKNGLTANLSLHYRGSSIWTELAPFTYTDVQTASPTTIGGKAKKYLIANLRLGYEFKMGDNDAEVALAIFNLGDAKYDNYPISTSDVRRRITASFTYRF
ncbi:TonB-dependent receptor plug domain-containing protein [Candidatus Omnitrophota bacterium]